MLHFCLTGHFSDGLDGDARGNNLWRVSFGVGRGGGSTGAGATGLSVSGVARTSSADRLLRLSLVLVVVCLDGAVDAATAPPAAVAHHVSGDGGSKKERNAITTSVLC